MKTKTVDPIAVVSAVERFARAQATAWAAFADSLSQTVVPVVPVVDPPSPPPPTTYTLVDSDVARRLGVSVFTVRSWRHKRIGPRYKKFGRAVRYSVADVDAFAEAQ